MSEEEESGDNITIWMADNKHHLLAALNKIGAFSVVVSYSGSGDSGGIDVVTVLDGNGKEIDIRAMNVEMVTKVGYTKPEGGFKEKTEKEFMSLESALAEFTNDWLQSEHSGWYDGDVGDGEMTIIAGKGEFSLGHNERVTDSEHYEHSFTVTPLRTAIFEARQKGEEEPDGTPDASCR